MHLKTNPFAVANTEPFRPQSINGTVFMDRTAGAEVPLIIADLQPMSNTCADMA